MMPKCDFKCDKECGSQVCQNSELASAADIDTDDAEIVNLYLSNPLTEAIVFQGLEPFDSWEDLARLIDYYRLVVDTFEAERIKNYDLFQNIKISNEDQHKVDWEIKRRKDEIIELEHRTNDKIISKSRANKNRKIFQF